MGGGGGGSIVVVHHSPISTYMTLSDLVPLSKVLGPSLPLWSCSSRRLPNPPAQCVPAHCMLFVSNRDTYRDQIFLKVTKEYILLPTLLSVEENLNCGEMAA